MDRIEGFPDELRARVLHLIVAHHGDEARGSPKPPMTLEAMATHLLDHLDSQTQAVAQVLRDTRSADGWSETVRLLERPLFRGTPGSNGTP
jgi:3'-5' exoribonuclease